MFLLPRFTTASAVLALSLFTSALFAQGGAPQIVVNLNVEKEVVSEDRNGEAKIKREPVQITHPGDILVYTLHYINEGGSKAWRISLNDPIPAGTVFLLGSAEGAGSEIRYSIDEGKTFQHPPLRILVTDEDGREKEVDAPPEMYTHILWTIEGPIARGESGKVSFKVQVQ